MPRTTTVMLACDATGLATGPTDRDFGDDEPDFDTDSLLDAPDGWLAMIVVRVRPNPAYIDPEAVQAPTSMTQDGLQEFIESVRGGNQPQYLVDQATMYLTGDKAHELDKAMPGCWDGVDGFEDLALTANPQQAAK